MSDSDRHSAHDAISRYLDAAGAGDTVGVRVALSAGVPIDSQNRRRETAILRAARGGYLETVQMLIDAGADIDLQDDMCQNPFLFGCITGNLHLVRVMVEAGTDISRLTRFGGNGLTPAAEKGHVEVVRYLLENTDIDPNLTNTLGWTALIEAITLGDGGPAQQDTIRLLLAHGADPEMTDERGVAPVELARRHGFLKIAHLIEGILPSVDTQSPVRPRDVPSLITGESVVREAAD